MWLIDFNNVAIEKIQPDTKPTSCAYTHTHTHTLTHMQHQCVCVRVLTTIYFYICLASCVEMGQKASVLRLG